MRNDPNTGSPRLHASDNVRAESARRGFSFKKVREAIDMSRSTWDRRMAEPGSWRLGELDGIARYLGVPIDRLADGNQA